MTAARFIAFEGGEGTGKSTQSRLLAAELEKRGLDTIQTREPGGTPGAEAIRSMLLNPPGDGWGARAEALLFAAARSDHVEKLIKPALARGTWVVCDRFVDSSRAYQGGAGGIGDDAVNTLHAIGSQGLRPDITILVDVPPAVVAQRLAERDGDTSDAIGGRDAEYHTAVARTFLQHSEADPAGFAVISGEGTMEDVHARVMSAIAPMLEGAE